MRTHTAKKAGGGFSGFSKKAFSFFRSIEFYQSREWYTENKAIYEKEALLPMICLVNELTERMKDLGLPLAGDPKKSLFRIHRDVRFSKDKTPYRTHIGATLSRDGRKLSPGMVYVHVSPERSFVALGTYHPASEELAAIRAAIANKQKRWLNIIHEMREAGLELSTEDMLKRLPRGYESFADSPVADYLKRRSFIVRRDLPHASLGNRKMMDELIKFVEDGHRLLTFTWSAIDTNIAEKNRV